MTTETRAGTGRRATNEDNFRMIGIYIALQNACGALFGRRQTCFALAYVNAYGCGSAAAIDLT